MKKYIMVTGGCGFIGTNFIIEFAKAFPDYGIINIDSLTYAATSAFERDGLANYKHYKMDIANGNIYGLMSEYRPEFLFNFAAESHVDRSIKNPGYFFNTNVLSTQKLLDTFKDYAEELKTDPVFLHVSTDEVYGSLSELDYPSVETDQYKPNSPYAASKAASDHIVRAYHKTYGLNTIITNCSNNYGPYQHEEKFIPTVILSLLRGKKIPIYGNGQNMRDWLFVEDHCKALIRIFKFHNSSHFGQHYNIGSDDPQRTNAQMALIICGLMGKGYDSIEYVEDRKGHDFRYDINWSKINREFNWQPMIRRNEGLIRTIDWYTQRFNKGFYNG